MVVTGPGYVARVAMVAEEGGGGGGDGAGVRGEGSHDNGEKLATHCLVLPSGGYHINISPTSSVQ